MKSLANLQTKFWGPKILSTLYLGISFLFVVGMGSFAAEPFSVALNMIPEQKAFFEKEILASYLQKGKGEISIHEFKDNKKIATLLEKGIEGKEKPPLGLIMIPQEFSRNFIKEKKIIAFNSFLSEDQIADVMDTYFLVDMYTVNDQVYLIPRKLETRLLAYRKSKVAEAVENWKSVQKKVNKIIKKTNGKGLPKGYLLEADPNEWDFFDLFVAGFYWAKTEKAGRISHRGKKYEGTVTGLMDRILQCGGTPFDLLDFERESVADMFSWEAMMVKNGVFNSKLWTEKWSGFDIWKAFMAGETHLAFMTQIDCFFLANGQKGGPYIKPEDLGIAVLPAGNSIDLNKEGTTPLREGKHAGSTGGWWWGIPKNSPDPMAAFEFISFINSKEIQQKECGKFGIVPVRMEMIVEPGNYFENPLTQKIFEISQTQLLNNGPNSVPSVKQYKALQNLYLDAFYSIIIKGYRGKKKNVTFKGIQKILKKHYAKKIQKIQ